MEIVATFVQASGRDPREELASPPAGATTIELRADLLDGEVDLDGLVSACPLPVVVTLRSAAEGGRGPDDPASRRRFLERAAASRAALVDLEADRDRDCLGTVVAPERAILSKHLPRAVPADLEEQTRSLLASPARLVKIVPRATGLDDALAVLRLGQAMDRGPRAARRAIVFASGEAGRATRLLGPLLAAPLAFASWGEGREAAAGQYPPAEIAFLAGHLQGRPRRVFAVLGNPVSGSLSPRMHAAAYRALSLPDLFVPIEVGKQEELDALLAPLGASCLDGVGLSAGGFAVTMPWKEEAARRCTLLAPRAQRARAANTVLPRPGRLVGDCTDIDGIGRALLDAGIDPGGEPAVVLGTGAAARAAAVALDLAGAEVALTGRDAAKVEETARELGVHAVAVSATERFSIVVNATPAGRDGELGTLLGALRAPAGALVIDMPYGPVPTALERLSAERGWHYVSGRELLLSQGIAQFAAMHGAAPPVRAMAAAIGLEETQS
jgi:shikimate dehydrogenase/3-dehydroquinate dehydratase type I